MANSALTELQQQIEAIGAKRSRPVTPLRWRPFENWRRNRLLKETGAQQRRGEVQEDVADFAQPRRRHRIPDRGDAGQNAAATLA
jgi:hypothetical protein